MPKITEHSKGFTQGFVCAITVAIRNHGMSTEVKNMWQVNSMSIADLKKHEVDEHDILTIKKHWKELNHGSFKILV